MRDIVENIVSQPFHRTNSIPATMSIGDAMVRMHERAIPEMIVMARGVPVGTVGTDEVRHYWHHAVGDPTLVSVSEIMTTKLVCVSSATTIRDAMTSIVLHRCHHLVVVDGPVYRGAISTLDITQWLMRSEDSATRTYIEHVSASRRRLSLPIETTSMSSSVPRRCPVAAPPWLGRLPATSAMEFSR